MAGPRFFLRVFAAGVAWLSAVAAHADSLRADFSPLTLRPRTNAPAIFDIKLHRQGAGLLEGALEITLEAGGDVLHRQCTQDLTLAAGAQAFRVITPPLSPRPTYTGTEARLRFITKAGATELGRFSVEGVGRGVRNFVIAVCDRGGAGVRDVALWQSLRLEGLFPAEANAANFISTSPAYLAPEDFPANPLALFAFDLVLLEGDGFALLREKQLAALTRWVEAGGSLCVLPGRGLKDEHARFLQYFASAKEPAFWRIPDTGGWTPNDSQPRLLRVGLGHVVLAAHPADDALTAAAWQRGSAFLWKMRGAKSGQFLASSKWSQANNFAKVDTEARPAAEERRREMEHALKTLLPKSARLISPLVLALILAGFLLVVGPLDWFTLGALRRRRWTWLVFPLASAGCTALVVFEAGRDLGHEDHRGALTITDVGAGGRVLRASRFELLFAARNQESRAEIRNALALPIALRSRDERMDSADGNAAPVSFSGQLPVRFTLRQQLRQWTPQFNRVTSLEEAGAAPGIPWEEIETNVVQGRAPKFALSTIAKQQSSWSCGLFHGVDDPMFIFGQKEASGRQPARRLCVSSLRGLGVFRSRNSPDAADGFEDLPLLDESDPHEWLLVVFQVTPEGVQIYRRLFRTDD